MPDTPTEPDLGLRETFPFWSTEKIRFSDIDRQNHVNNLAVCSYIESGRVELREREFPELARDQSISWLVVNFEIAFKAAIGYPGTVDVRQRHPADRPILLCPRPRCVLRRSLHRDREDHHGVRRPGHGRPAGRCPTRCALTWNASS